MHLLTVETEPPAALFDLIAEHGTTTSVDRSSVTITLAEVGFVFAVYHIGCEEDPGRIAVFLDGYTIDVPPLRFEEIQVCDPHRRQIPVTGDAARRIADRKRIFGRCQPCQHDRHTRCAYPAPDHRCRCVCGDEWASGRMTDAIELAALLDSEEASPTE